MVHQLSFVLLIPHNKYTQTVTTLQALTGQLSPQPISTYTLVTKPHNEFRPKFEPGKINQIEQYYMKCTTTWTNNDDFIIQKPFLEEDELLVDRLFEKQARLTWTLQISDIPIAGKNQLCSAQTIYESTLVHTHTVSALDGAKDSFLQFLEDLGYDLVNQYWIKGVRFFHGDVVIEIFKVFVRDDVIPSKNNKINLKLLDELNTFQVKMYSNVAKATEVEVITQAQKELLRLQDGLKNLFALEIPDRMMMDSRLRA